MKLLVLQHVEFEGPAAIKDWALSNGHTITYQCCPTQLNYPTLESFDCLIIMGGPMGVNDKLAWMTPELAFIKRAISAKKMILGICLGAQIIASALGASIRKNQCREIGWYSVQTTKPDLATTQWAAATLPSAFTPLHWHSDTFDLPAEAIHLLQSDACTNQAYSVGEHIIGLQFHLEFNTDTAKRVGEACADELDEGGQYVQTLQEILLEKKLFNESNQLMFKFLDAFHQQFLRLGKH